MQPSWLVSSQKERERLVDMSDRLTRVRKITFLIQAVALIAMGPWLGWWPILMLGVAAAGFTVLDRYTHRLAQPEYAAAATWMLAQLMIASAIALTGGLDSPAVAWLAIPVVSLSSRFSSRGVAAGLGVTIVLLLASTLAAHPQHVLDRPQFLIAPLVLIAAVALLSTALMQSDLHHRSESVLDGLTAMLNRRALATRVAELAEQATLTSQPIGLVLGDLDRFKLVNDEHGHATGDAVLVDVASTLRRELRAFDLAYRLGGEEFLVVVPGASLEEARELAEKLRAAVEETPAGGLEVTMSFGVASSDGGILLFDELLAEADGALYASKHAGRNAVSAASSPAESVPVA